MRLWTYSSVCAALAVSAGLLAQDVTTTERGQALYADQRCRLCHSIGDEGNKRGPLDGVGERLSAEELELWLVDPQQMTEKTGATRKPDMPAYTRLSQEEIDVLVAYMLSLTS